MENILIDDDILQERQRSARFNTDELILLNNLIKKYKDKLLNKKTGKVHPKQREEAWESLTVEFNNDLMCTRSRSVNQLKNKWDYMKRSAKKDVAAYKREYSQTGGGKGPRPLDDTTTILLDTVRESVVGVPSYFDSDRDFSNIMVKDSKPVDILTPTTVTLPEELINQTNCHASTLTGIDTEEKSTSLKNMSQNRKRQQSGINRSSPQYTRSKFVEVAERKIKLLDDKEDYIKIKASMELEVLKKKSDNASLENKKLELECEVQNLEISIRKIILKQKKLELILLEKEVNYEESDSNY